MDIVLFSGSLRKDSLNKKLLAVAERFVATQSECRTHVVDLQALQLPVYDGDIEARGMPEGVKEIGGHIQSAQGLIIASPEYNGSIAGSLKNTIDWISRLRPVPLEKKAILLLGASPGAFGTIRALGANRAPLENLGAFVYPQPFALPKAHEAFSPSGELVDGATLQRLTSLITNYLQYVKRLQA